MLLLLLLRSMEGPVKQSRGIAAQVRRSSVLRIVRPPSELRPHACHVGRMAEPSNTDLISASYK